MKLYVKVAKPSLLLMDIICATSDPKLAERLGREMFGIMVCLGYIRDATGEERKRQDSNLMIFICRDVSCRREYVDIKSKEYRLGRSTLRICRNRSLLESWKPRPNDEIMLFPVGSISRYHRIFRAVHNLSVAPKKILNIMFGNRIPRRLGEESFAGRERLLDQKPKWKVSSKVLMEAASPSSNRSVLRNVIRLRRMHFCLVSLLSLQLLSSRKFQSLHHFQTCTSEHVKMRSLHLVNGEALERGS